MTLRTRQPTGQVAYPLVLVEGAEKSGKTALTLSLSASEHVGRMFVFELGERAADEYASLGEFEIVEHNGTYHDLLAQVRAATREPAVEDRPNAIVLDSASMLWALLKDHASTAARRSQRARKILENDPDADIEVTQTYWNAAKDKWWAVINLLRTWPGIVILTARGREVSKVVNGQPVAGQTEWSIEIEKGTPFAMSAIVRTRYPNPPLLTAVQSLQTSIPEGGLLLPDDATLEHLIFRVLGAGGKFENGRLVNPALGHPVAEAKQVLWAEVPEEVKADTARAKALCERAWSTAGLDGRDEVTEDELEAVCMALAVELAREDSGGDADEEAGRSVDSDDPIPADASPPEQPTLGDAA